MKAVTLSAAYRIWNAGETAGFPDDEAERLISAGIARPVDASEKQEDENQDEGKAPAESKRGKR